MKGTVQRFNPKSGFGFIDGEDGEPYFVHQNDINMEGFRSLNPGEEVSFEVEQGEKGLKAVSVNLLSERIQRRPQRHHNRYDTRDRQQGHRPKMVSYHEYKKLQQIVDRLIEILAEDGEDVEAILGEEDVDYIRSGRQASTVS